LIVVTTPKENHNIDKQKLNTSSYGFLSDTVNAQYAGPASTN
jgi:hypothetical protein